MDAKSTCSIHSIEVLPPAASKNSYCHVYPSTVIKEIKMSSLDDIYGVALGSRNDRLMQHFPALTEFKTMWEMNYFQPLSHRLKTGSLSMLSRYLIRRKSSSKVLRRRTDSRRDASLISIILISSRLMSIIHILIISTFYTLLVCHYKNLIH